MKLLFDPFLFCSPQYFIFHAQKNNQTKSNQVHSHLLSFCQWKLHLIHTLTVNSYFTSNIRSQCCNHHRPMPKPVFSLFAIIKTMHSLLTFYVAQQTLLFGMAKGILHQRHQTRHLNTIFLGKSMLQLKEIKMMIMESHKEHFKLQGHLTINYGIWRQGLDNARSFNDINSVINNSILWWQLCSTTTKAFTITLMTFYNKQFLHWYSFTMKNDKHWRQSWQPQWHFYDDPQHDGMKHFVYKR